MTHYAETAVEVFLPQLENGLSDENWRIRYSSIQLLGDLLYHISGVTGKMTTVSDEDDNFGTEHSTQALMQILGVERRNRVLSGLYMSRLDEAVTVRQAALHVWKIVVANTARTLRDILPVLLSILLKSLASVMYDRRQVRQKLVAFCCCTCCTGLAGRCSNSGRCSSETGRTNSTGDHSDTGERFAL